MKHWFVASCLLPFVTLSGYCSHTGKAPAQPQTITFAALPNVLYGAQVALNATSTSGLPVRYQVDGSAVRHDAILRTTGVGTVTVIAFQDGNAKYLPATPVQQSFTISPAPLTITAENASTVVNRDIPRLKLQYSGLVDGDTRETLPGEPSISTTAVEDSPAGFYPITVAAGTLVDPNYSITFVNGTLTIYNRERDIWQQPFAQDSIWNTPIGDKAVYYKPGILPLYYVNFDSELFYRTKSTDPVQPVYVPNGWQTRCGGTAEQIAGTNETMLIPDNLIIPDAYPGSTPNNCAAFLQPDKQTIYQLSPATRCVAGGPVYGFFNTDFPTEALAGEGYYGTHFGSGLSALGGSLRYGELTGTAPIRHALHLETMTNSLYFDPNGVDTTGYANKSTGVGFRWPAIYNDAAAPTTYVGTDPKLTMGALMAIPANVTPESLNITSQPGLQLFHALQTYGAYIVDTTNFATPTNTWTAYQFGVQAEGLGEFQEHYGYSFDGYSGNTAASKPWQNDLNAMITALAVVDDNSPTSIGGHGKRLAPPAGPLVPMDRVPPTAPTNLQVSNLSTESALLSWTGSTDNVRVMDYKIYNGSTLLGTTYGKTSLSLPSLQPGQAFSIYAIAEDTDLNASAPSNTVNFVTPQPAVNNFEEFFQTDPNWSYNNAWVSGGQLTVMFWGWPAAYGEAIDTAPGATVANGYSFTSDVSAWGGCSGNIARIFFNYQDDNNTYAFEWNGFSNCGAASAWAQLVRYQNGSPTWLGWANMEYSAPTTNITVTKDGLITVTGVNGDGSSNVIFTATDTTFTGGKVGFGVNSDGIGVHNMVVTPLQ